MTPATTASARLPAAAARKALALAVAAILPLAAGCDDQGQGRTIELGGKAAAVRFAGGTADESLLSPLAEAANSTRADGATIEAKLALARLKLDQAHRDAVAVAAQQAQAAALVYQIASLANRAASAAQLAGTYGKYDPAPSVQALNGFAASARGDGNGTQFAADVPNVSLPTLAAAEQAKSKLEGEIADAQARQGELVKQRDASLAQAGDLAGKADQATGQARVDLVTQAADARGKAAGFAREIAALDSTLMRQKADVAVQAALQTQLATAVETFGGQAKALQAGWTNVQTGAANLSSLAKQTFTGKEEGTVNALAAQLTEQLKSIDEQSTTADTTYKEGIALLDGAGQAAGTLVRDISSAKSSGKPYESDAWDAESKLYAADRVNTEKGMAELEYANYLAGRAAFVGHIAETAAALEPVAKAVGVSAPAPFEAGKRKDELAALIKSADEAYTASDTTLEGITGGDQSLAAVRSLSTTGKILGRYAHGKLAAYAKSRNVAPDVAAKTTLIADAKAAAVEARSNNVVLPRLPEEITPPAPTTAPATEGAAPAEGATPPAEGTAAPATPPAEGAAPAAPAQGAAPAAEGAAPAAATPADGAGPAAPPAE